ncbi:MAG: DIP1984 family protein [Oscillospiraceae bacterium]|nr:DIP1984 family protein [Oscillospiraceae bacterium]
MKLAEALQMRADLQRRISQLSGRLHNNARVQEGEQTPEDPEQLLDELEDCFDELETLMARINLTNSLTLLPEGSLTELLARRDRMTQQLGILRSFLDAASSLTSRSTRSEIRILSAVDVRRLQKDCDRRSAELRTLETSIQAANWTTDLLEN